jgi:hypothetical protein
MSESLLDRYNAAYNLECVALPSGGPVSMEHLQAITLECLLKATQATNIVFVGEVKELIEALYEQGNRNG